MSSPARALYVQPRTKALVLSRRSLLRPDPTAPTSPFSRFVDRYQAELDEMPESMIREIEIFPDVTRTAVSLLNVCKAFRTQITTEVLAHAS
jgi:hypothetical protein